VPRPAARPRLPRARSLAPFAYSAVIPTKDRAARAEAAVAGLLSQTRLPARIVVVDASDPPLRLGHELRKAARSAAVELVVLHSAPSTSRQRNRGVQHVQTPLTLLLDDDVRFEPGYVEILIERWAKDGLSAFGALVGSQVIIERQWWLSRLLRMASMLHYDALRSSSTSFRRSRKLRFVPVPADEVVVPACGAGYGLFRTQLLRRHPFDERFAGYAPGEDLDMSSRLSSEAPILQLPDARWTHDENLHERTSVSRWRQRGRTETYFRLRHLQPTLLCRIAFALSLVTETLIAAAHSLRHRDRHVLGYLCGVLETLRERDFRYERLPGT
jgi:GT2 family glycosyltransferase